MRLTPSDAFVGNTGWRASEFGFPKSSILVEKNPDTLDGYAFPFRYQIEWHIFKTQGGTMAEREINQSSFELLQKLINFNGQGDNEPAMLYSEGAKDPFTPSYSKTKINISVQRNWTQFAKNYEPFLIIDQIKEYNELNEKKENNKKLSSVDSKRLSEIVKNQSAIWDGIASNISLKEAYTTVRNELSLVDIITMTSTTAVRQNWLDEYKKYLKSEVTHFPLEILEIFDKAFDEDYKDFIITSPADIHFRKEVQSYLTNDLTYPTPHAFRHIWAEAVFKRYSGEAGWIIRSNFKYISESMWFAYISGKQQKGIEEKIKVRISSSIMKNWIKNQGKETTGKFHNYLSRLFGKTSIVNIDNYSETVDMIAENDVISVKANPWGFCFNRKKTSLLAKCTESGSANPQRATPELCLGCINYIADSSNIEYIIFQCYTHLDFVKSSKQLLNKSKENYLFIESNVEESFNFLELARKRIFDLDYTHAFITELDDVLSLKIKKVA